MDEPFTRWLADRDPEVDWAAATAVAEQLAPELIGSSVAAAVERARAVDVIIRVVRGEGALGRVTRDRRPNRVNVAVEDGTIVSAEVY
ncbi:MAG TPA: hypothetical protein VH062_20030 [Polyangiaceae bacterium]|nr:hypothetical protein [Polyangiaceae bacterium]